MGENLIETWGDAWRGDKGRIVGRTRKQFVEGDSWDEVTLKAQEVARSLVAEMKTVIDTYRHLYLSCGVPPVERYIVDLSKVGPIDPLPKAADYWAELVGQPVKDFLDGADAKEKVDSLLDSYEPWSVNIDGEVTREEVKNRLLNYIDCQRNLLAEWY